MISLTYKATSINERAKKILKILLLYSFNEIKYNSHCFQEIKFNLINS